MSDRQQHIDMVIIFTHIDLVSFWHIYFHSTLHRVSEQVAYYSLTGMRDSYTTPSTCTAWLPTSLGSGTRPWTAPTSSKPPLRSDLMVSTRVLLASSTHPVSCSLYFVSHTYIDPQLPVQVWQAMCTWTTKQIVFRVTWSGTWIWTDLSVSSCK